MKKYLFITLFFLCLSINVCAQDYAAFDVKGPVKRIEYNRPDLYDLSFLGWDNTYEFSRKGFCKKFVGEYFQRDAKGRITAELIRLRNPSKIPDLDVSKGHYDKEWYYNAKGQLYWIYAFTIESNEYYVYTYTFYYDKNGEMNKIRCRRGQGYVPKEDYPNYYDDYSVHILKRDSRGNWTERELRGMGKDKDLRVHRETRKIYYY